MKFSASLSLLILVISQILASGVKYEKGQPILKRDSELGNYTDAAIASDARPCAKIAMDVMREGGHAVDAAIAATLCDGLFNPQSTGIGGGMYMTLYIHATNEVIALDARETAPLYANRDMYDGDTMAPREGVFAMAVPGMIKGLYEAKTRYGNSLIPWARLIQPSIDMCNDGIEVGFSLAYQLVDKQDKIKNDPGLSEIFLDPDTGEVWPEGANFTWPNLAQTLQRIAINGADELYYGFTGVNMANDIQMAGGNFTTNDLMSYSTKWGESVSVDLGNNLTFHSLPPPSSGLILANILNILKNYGFQPNDIDDMDVPHRIIEAFKWGFASRSKLGDPADPEITNFVNELVANLTSDELAYETFLKINDSYTVNDPEYYGGEYYEPEDHGTAHISVMDPLGNAVALTSTINLNFGCKFMSPFTGIILNDEMDDFSYPNISNYFGVPPSPQNFPIPGKRPVSSMSPAIIVDENKREARMVVGAAGGTRIITANALVSMSNLWFGEDIKTAVDKKRIHHQLMPMEVSYEFGTNEFVLETLRSKGHIVNEQGDGSISGVITREEGRIYAMADGRKDGATDGF